MLVLMVSVQEWSAIVEMQRSLCLPMEVWAGRLWVLTRLFNYQFLYVLILRFC